MKKDYVVIPASGRDSYVEHFKDDRDEENIRYELFKTPIVGWAIGKEVGEAYPITCEGIKDSPSGDHIVQMFGATDRYQKPYDRFFSTDAELIEYFREGGIKR